MKKFIILYFIIIVIFSGCGKKEKVKIAIMTKLSTASIVGSSEINASKLFLEKNNEKNIEIYTYDDQWLPEEAIKQYNKVKEDGINILITSHVSSCIVAIEEMINQDKILTFVTGATTDVISNKDDFIFRNIQDVKSEQISIANYMAEKFHNLLIIRDIDNYAYTEPALKYFLENFTNNYKIIEISISNLNLDNLRQVLSGLSFDSVYLLIGGYQVNAGSVAQLVNIYQPGLPIMYTPWMKSPTLLETAGKTIEHSVIPSHYPPLGEHPKILDYLDDYEMKFGSIPTYISLNVYTALEIIHQAIKSGNKTPEKIKEYILKNRKFETSFSEIFFNDYGDIEAELYFITDIKKEFHK